MKTVEQLIFEKRFKNQDFDPNDYNDWAKENEWEAYNLCLEIANEFQKAEDAYKLKEYFFKFIDYHYRHSSEYYRSGIKNSFEHWSENIKIIIK